MKNKLSRFAVPYVVWMAIFVVAPILIMVVYAFSNADDADGASPPRHRQAGRCLGGLRRRGVHGLRAPAQPLP